MGEREFTRGSAEPSPERDEAELSPDELDEELAREGGAVPRLDASDPGESGAPARSLDTQSGSGPGPGARYEGAPGGAGAKAEGFRRRGQDVEEDEELPPGRGPEAGLHD